MLYGLVAILLLQIGISAWVYWPRATSSPTALPILVEMSADEVVRLAVTDDEGERIDLVKNEDQWWALLSARGQEGTAPEPACGEGDAQACFPAANAKVETFLNALADLTTARLVANSEASYARLRVADDRFMRRIDLRLQDDVRHTLLIGTAPRFGAAHVRAADRAAVYLADNLNAADADVSIRNWIDTLYFQAAESEIRALQISNANGAIAFTRDENGVWRMAGLAEEEEFNAGPLVAMLPYLINLNMVEPLGVQELPEYGMDQPGAVLTLTTTAAAGESRALAIGAQGKQGLNYVAKSSDSPYYVLVSDYNVERLIESAREDFLTPRQIAPAPQAKTTPAPADGQP